LTLNRRRSVGFQRRGEDIVIKQFLLRFALVAELIVLAGLPARAQFVCTAIKQHPFKKRCCCREQRTFGQLSFFKQARCKRRSFKQRQFRWLRGEKFAAAFGLFLAGSRIAGSAAITFRLSGAIALAMAALMVASLAARAQVVAPSQVTPEALRPPAPSGPSPPKISGGEALKAPAGADKLSFIAGRVTIKGAFPELDNETRAFIKAVKGRRVTVARIYELANTMEQAYARAGYVLVRVTVPEQKLVDGGPLEIVVVDGFIEKVEVDKVPELVRASVAARLAWLVGRKHIKLADIERHVLIAGEVPGLRLKSTLERGKTADGVLLVLEGTHQVVTATATVDDRMPASLGTWTYGTTVSINSAFGFGEQIYGSAQAGGDPAQAFDPASPLRILGAGMVLPLGVDGWTVNPEFTYSRTLPVPAFGGPVNLGTFDRFALRTTYPVIRTRTQTFSLNGAFEYIDQTVFLPMFNSDLNHDRYSVLRAGPSLDTVLPWYDQTLQVSASFSQGLGGRDPSDGVPLSRPGASPFFSHANFDGHWVQPLKDGFRFDLIGRGQTSFGQPQMLPEQFFLDSPLAISSYPTGSLPVDEGATLRAELSRPFSVPDIKIPLVLSPYLFGAYGAGRLDEPKPLEVAMVHAATFGAGVRSNIDGPDGYRGISIALEAARQYTNLPTLPQAWRENIVVNMRF
jgi:hemolysin activation/secretion protein